MKLLAPSCTGLRFVNQGVIVLWRGRLLWKWLP